MFKTLTLPNGLQIVAEAIPFVRSVSFGIWVKNGSRNENKVNNGISHFIEHMLFKGTKTRTAKQIADEFDAIGGQLNAYTAKEMTCYYARVLDSHFLLAVDVLADMFFNSSFADEEIEKEKNVILEEISMNEDSPEDVAVELLQYNAYRNDSLGYAILGTEDTISSFDNIVFCDYFTKNYRPENTVIAIAGNFDFDYVCKIIEKYFSDFPVAKPYKTPQYSAVYQPCRVKREKDVEQLHLCLAFPGTNIGADDIYQMTALNTLFGGGMSSRLFQNIREKHGLVYSIYSYNSGYIDTGIFTICAAMNPSQIKKAAELIVDEIKGLYTDRVTPEYLNKTKEQLKSNVLLSLENSSSRMTSLGRSQLLLGRIISPDDIIKKIDAVSVEGLYELIEKVFVIDKISVSAVGKVKNLDLDELI